MVQNCAIQYTTDLPFVKPLTLEVSFSLSVRTCLAFVTTMPDQYRLTDLLIVKMNFVFLTLLIYLKIVNLYLPEMSSINPLQPGVAFLYLLKTSHQKT